jgi:hypothetical protein
MKTLNNLQEGDYIAFEDENELFVDSITTIRGDLVLVHFLDGYKSRAAWIKKQDIIAIGDSESTGKINGWRGTYNILLSNHKLLNKQ